MEQRKELRESEKGLIADFSILIHENIITKCLLRARH